MVTTKAGIRRVVLNKLKTLTPAQRRVKSVRIAKSLLESQAFQSARAVCFYVSLPSEVATDGLIRKAIECGKQVVVPKPELRTHALKLFEIKDLKLDLKQGLLGIREPDPLRTRPVDEKSVDLVIVPGVAFDEAGNRLGRGAGYYDRFLKKLKKKTLKIGLAFGVQIVKAVPVERHDVRLDAVITEKNYELD